jgi:hypothetical protein
VSDRTEKEQRAIAESQRIIKEETKKITESVTRILMLGGPKFVETILTSLLETNKDITEKLKFDAKVEFTEGGK